MVSGAIIIIIIVEQRIATLRAWSFDITAWAADAA